jgi:hypothetical protein
MTTAEMSLTQYTIDTIMHRALVLDYSWEATMLAYESEYDFTPAQHEPMPNGPPSPPPNTPVSSPPPTPPQSPVSNGIH